MTKPDMTQLSDADIAKAVAADDVDEAFGPLMDKVGVDDGGAAEIMLMSYLADNGLDGWATMTSAQRREFVGIWVRSEPNYHDEVAPRP